MDDDLKNFEELQHTLITNTQLQKQLVQQQQKMKINIQRHSLTATEVDALPDATPVYRAVGRAYFKTAKDAVMSSLEKELVDFNTQLNKLGQQKEHLEKLCQSTESELREVLANSPALQEKLAKRMG